MEKIKRFFKNEEGVTVIEYAVIAALIIVGCIVAITATGGAVRTTFNNIVAAL